MIKLSRKIIEESKRMEKEDEHTQEVLKIGKRIKKRGYLTLNEFRKIGHWKAARAKRNYWYKNKDKTIINISKEAFLKKWDKYEKRRIEILCKLKGVKVPIASAILAMVYPEKYGVIDIYAWKYLKSIKLIKKQKKTGFNSTDWFEYISKIRWLAKKYNTTPRIIDFTLYLITPR